MFLGGDVRTMDLAHPHATAVAVTGDTIAAVGSDGDIQPWIGKQTQIVQLAGRTLTPGLVDAHCHLYELGQDLEQVSVREAASADDAARIVGEAAKTRPANAWVLGRGWDQNKWPGQQFPVAATLDAIAHPVLLERVDGHAIWVNTRALQLAGITDKTPDPAGGRIVRDDKGAPTGVLVDNATALVYAKLPKATPEERERRIRAAADLAIASGLTGIHEMGIEDATADVYMRLADSGRLPLRVYAFLLGDPAHLERLATHPGPRHGNFQMRGVKFFADGALGSRGARLYADYDDAPGTRGLWVTDPDVLARSVEVAVAHDWQVAIHAIGDAGVGSVLDAYLAAEAKHPGERRLRVEHLQILAPDDLPRLVKSHAIASMQPTHATSDMPWAEARIGPKRILGAYAWRTVLDAGVPLAFGSDFPVEQVNPLLGIYAAVTRQDAKGNPPGGWYPQQEMSLDEALAAFTRGAAYAELAEAQRGTIAVGHDADLTMFAHALAPDTMLLHETVMLTIVGGKIVYRRPPQGTVVQP
ncbi:MAG TPA: amidohydrolase [Kofleriaceae bacterium]|nr:amidohydrolase [Kofleriaceae bacterium]